MTLHKVGGGLELVGALCIGLAAITLQFRSCQRDRAWEATAKAAVAHADSVLAISETRIRLVDSIVRAAQAKDSAASRAARWAARRRQDADSLAGASPDSLTVPKAAYEALGQAYDSLNVAYQTQIQASGDLIIALEIERQTNEDLRFSLERSTQVLRDRPHPSGPCGLGVGAGWGIHGPDAVIGVTCKINLALPRLHL